MRSIYSKLLTLQMRTKGGCKARGTYKFPRMLVTAEQHEGAALCAGRPLPLMLAPGASRLQLPRCDVETLLPHRPHQCLCSLKAVVLYY